MGAKELPFTKEQIESIIRDHPTPFHIYDEDAIRANVRRLIKAFDWAHGFKEYFAVKATPNPHILKILHEEGCGADCSSLAELVLAERTGLAGGEIVFTSNDTPAVEYVKAKQLGALINLDDISHIDFLERTAGIPESISCRYNPGPLRSGNAIIGNPQEAKYGFTREQIFEGYSVLRKKGVRSFGLHTMVASNELNNQYFIDTAVMLFELALEVFEKTGVRIESVNLGGGFGIPYGPEDEPVSIELISKGIRLAYDERIKNSPLHPLKIYMESGRLITGPCGFLVSKVLHLKDTYKKYAGLDSCMANLMRPAVYGAYHHITVLGKEHLPAGTKYDVTGSLCENNDKFAIDRMLPKLEPGDIIVIHDTGAHGHAMGFNYNGKLRSAELLLGTDGTVKLVRRAETLDDYFATLEFAER
ncbi:MAG: diaminopimelate decarboxylase [Spirochaetia bacterium]|jgi:diaminopimelate decarboxylase|nr:diaminopimelate decarboxylase [Spirochaetia bacterium]